MAGYSHKTWACPFFKWDEKLRIHCEGGRLALPDQAALRDYAGRYCASADGWRQCSFAGVLLRHYEKADGKTMPQRENTPT